MPDERPTKKQRLTSSIVKVSVGTDAQAVEFSVHEATLKQSSPFFKAAIDKKRNDGAELKIELPQDTADVVSIYIDYLYKGVLKDLELEPDWTVQDQFAHLYVFGEKVGDDVFCDHVMGNIIAVGKKKTADGSHCVTTQTAISILYNGTPSGSPARRLIVDYYVAWARSDDRWYKDGFAATNPELATELLRALTEAMMKGGGAAKTWREFFANEKNWFKSTPVQVEDS